jgi:hypothetical protein
MNLTFTLHRIRLFHCAKLVERASYTAGHMHARIQMWIPQNPYSFDTQSYAIARHTWMDISVWDGVLGEILTLYGLQLRSHESSNELSKCVPHCTFLCI